MLILVLECSCFFADFFGEILVGEAYFDFSKFFPACLDFAPIHFTFAIQEFFPGIFFKNNLSLRSSHLIT